MKKNDWIQQSSNMLHPFAETPRFWQRCSPSDTMLMVSPVFPSTPLLAFTGRTLLTTTRSSATSHQHEASAFTLNLCFRHLPGCGVRLPQLLHWLPVSYTTLKHVVGLTEYRASRYFGRLPTNTAESGSLALCTADFLWLPSDPSVSP